MLEFQSTRPRGARPYSPATGSGSEAVSIHAPARGATVYMFELVSFELGFNPRAREGRDAVDGVKGRCPGPVSIHAPARGATADGYSSINTTC